MAFWTKKQPVAGGEVPLATVILPTVDDAVVVVLPDDEISAHVSRIEGDKLGVTLDEGREDFALPDDAKARIRWKERGGRRTLEANARLVGSPQATDRTLWAVDIGSPERRDRRAYVRAPLRIRVALVKPGEEEPFSATSLDLSEISIAFELDPTEERTLDVEDEVRVAFTIDEERFAFGGQIVRTDRRRVAVVFPTTQSRERDQLRSKVLAATVRRS